MMQCNKFSPLLILKLALALRENNNRPLDPRIQNDFSLPTKTYDHYLLPE
jgi:hypothetical protein